MQTESLSGQSGIELDVADIHLLLDTMTAASAIVNRDNQILYASPLAKMLPLFADGQVSYLPLVQQNDRCRKRQRVIEADYEFRHEQAAVPWALLVRTVPISADRLLILVEDRTQALQNDATRRDFVVNASHELKTPVGAISLLAETIHENPQDVEAVSQFSLHLVKESRRLTKLVQEIISLARLQDGKLPVEAREVSVVEAVKQALGQVETAATNRQIQLYFQEPPPEATPGDCPAKPTDPYTVRADFELLTSVFQNLLENAIRYSDPGGEVKVQVSQGDNVEIKVIDQGIGISAEDQERIFERFYRVDPARSRSTGGTGLGLSIVKHVISDMDGRITVQSAPGQGATFTIILPHFHPDRELTGQVTGKATEN